MWKKKKKNKKQFDYDWHYKRNEDFYDRLITNVKLRHYLIVQGKDFSECINSHEVNNVACLDLYGEKISVYTGFSQISSDKFTKQRISAGAHRANFLDKNSKVVSPLLGRVNITELEEDFPGISRLLGVGFKFQRPFIAAHFSNAKYGLKNSELATVLAYVGGATLDFSAFLSSEQAVKFQDIGDLKTFLTFLSKLPEQEKRFQENRFAVSRQIENIDKVLIKHTSVIHEICSKIKNRKIS